jgi:thiol-disulfide isomerase/thioredoxin
MKNKVVTILGVAVLLLSGQRAFTADAAIELKALVTKVRADLDAGKKTEAELADDLKQFDVLLAEHQGEKTDAVANIVYMKAMLYDQVFNEPAKAAELVKQLKAAAAAKKMRASLVVGAKFPDFNEKDVAGKPMSIANDKGKVVLVDFWATWCGPCRAELPNVLGTYNKYHDKGFEIIGISLDQDQARLADFTKSMNMTWPQIFDGQGWQNKLAVKYGIESIPATFLLDGEGKIIGRDLRGEDLPAAVAKALAKN